MVVSTHPDIAALVTPLCPLGKEGLLLFPCPLCGQAAERAVQRSVDRVSQFCVMLFFNKTGFMPFHGLLLSQESNNPSNDREKNQMRGIDSPRHRCARHPSLRFAHRGGGKNKDFWIKEQGQNKKVFIPCSKNPYSPLSAKGEERVVQRSVDRVSIM